LLQSLDMSVARARACAAVQYRIARQLLFRRCDGGFSHAFVDIRPRICSLAARMPWRTAR